MSAVFKVEYQAFGDGFDWENDMTVAAKCVETAIAKVRKRAMSERHEKTDDNGDEIPGKFYKLSKIVIRSVARISEIDLT